MGEALRCSQCGAVMPAGAGGGLCPACGASNASRLEPAADQPRLRNSESGETGPDQSRSTMRAAILETAGDRIGHYRLLQQIGEGGCGVVFLAEQEQSVKRRVAIKVVKPGMDTRQVFARFEAERQALAMMDHPHIAKVFDAGATEVGRPYFVMEWVRGIRLTDYCDRNHLSTGERLNLFIQIGDANQDVAFLWANYGHCALRLGQSKQAESLLLAPLPVLRKTFGARHERTPQAILDLAELYEALGKSEARQYRALLDPTPAGGAPASPGRARWPNAPPSPGRARWPSAPGSPGRACCPQRAATKTPGLARRSRRNLSTKRTMRKMPPERWISQIQEMNGNDKLLPPVRCREPHSRPVAQFSL